MIQIVGTQLSQWDVGRSVNITDSDATHVHFANQGDSKAVIIEIENGSAKIPNYLLQTGKAVIAYAVRDGVTLESKSFSVRKRERPENYVYEDDQRNYIYELIAKTENALESLGRAVAVADDAAENAGSAAGMAYEAAQSANLAAKKANTATDNANLAAKNANEAVTKANNAVKNMMVVGGAEGASIALNNAIDQTLVGLRVFGKTTQNGTPTLDAPVELVSVGESGSITVNVNNTQSMTIATPNGLPGIPVTSGGNYTDANGQQWVCDEIDFAKGVYIQRINKKAYTGTEEFKLYSSGVIFYERFALKEYALDGGLYPSICSHLPYNPMEDLIGRIGQRFRKGANNQNRIYFAHPDFTTLEVFVNFAKEAYNAGMPLTVRYILNTPIETPLSEEELAAYASLHTYKDNTTVSNDAGAWMELEYVMDAKKYIDSLVGSSGTILPARVE